METMVTRHSPKRLKRQKQQSSFDADIMLQLYELLQGERDSVRVYSKELDSVVYFVNPDARPVKATPPECPVYTTRELAFVLSLTSEELKRYHYLKQKLA